MRVAGRIGLVLAALGALAAAGAASAQDVRSLAAGASPAPATLADLKGLVGDWTAKDGAAAFSAPAAGEMVGHLYLYTDEGPRLHELWVIKPEGGSVKVRQVFFNPDLTPRDGARWSERRLVGRDADHLYFENLTFETRGDALSLYVRVPGQNGAPPSMLTYAFHRAK